MQPAKAVAGTPKIPGFLRRMELIEGTTPWNLRQPYQPWLSGPRLDTVPGMLATAFLFLLSAFHHRYERLAA